MIGNYLPNREYTHRVVYSLVNYCNALQHVRAKLNLVIVSCRADGLPVCEYKMIFDLETKGFVND